MKISIVTPSYNYGRFIGDAIQSVIDQDYGNKEYIIMDGGSTDDTYEVVRSFGELSYLKWISEPDDGQTNAINKGFELASGDVVAWLNADDFYLPETFSRVAKAFKDNPDVDVIYGDTMFVDEKGNCKRIKKEHDFDFKILLYYGCYIQSTSTFFRRRIFEEGNKLNESFRVVMDYEYFLRIYDRGYKFKYLPEVLSTFRWHGDNVSIKNKEIGLREKLNMRKKYSNINFSNDMSYKIYFEIMRYVCTARRLAKKRLLK